jgi:hypothetical protein
VCRDPRCHEGCSCATRTATPTPALDACVGDCNGDGLVRIDELITGVDRELVGDSQDVCAALNCNNGPIPIINCLVIAVNNALGGCFNLIATPSPLR